MGVDVELRQRFPHAGKGKPKGRCVDLITDGHDVFADLLAKVRGGGRTPLLDRIDPYGDLALSGADMPRLLAELSILAAAAHRTDEKIFLESLMRAARQCAADPSDHRLHFVGD